jgi:hypothetical protein
LACGGWSGQKAGLPSSIFWTSVDQFLSGSLACYWPPKRRIFVECILGWPEGDGRFIIGFGTSGLLLYYLDV